MPSGSLPASWRCWVLRGAQQQRGPSVSRAVRQHEFCRETGYLWTCVLLAYRSRRITMVTVKRSYACDATTVATFAPFLAIRIGSWSPSSKVIPPSCSPRTFCDCCPRNSFARSMRRTGGRISNDGWGESRPEVQMVWIRFAVWVDLRDGS